MNRYCYHWKAYVSPVEGETIECMPKFCAFGCIAHVGYFVPFTKIADFLQAGVEVCRNHSSFLHHTCYTDRDTTHRSRFSLPVSFQGSLSVGI
jgi:hypothetical protein